MTTLGSWIDDEALAQVLRELCPDAAHRGDDNAPDQEPEQHQEPARQSAASRPEAAILPPPGDDPSPGSAEASPAHDDDSIPLESLPPALPNPPIVGSTPTLVARLAAVRQRAQRSGLIKVTGQGSTASSTNAPVAEYVPPDDSLAVRLAALEEWLRAQIRARDLCLADSRGEALTGASVPAGLAAASALLVDAIRHSRAEAGFAVGTTLHMPLAPGEVLTVIAVDTTDGLFSISVISPAPLSSRDTDRFDAAFRSAIADIETR